MSKKNTVEEEQPELIFSTDEEGDEGKKGNTVTGADNKGLGLRTTGFKDFFLRPELLRAIGEAGFEHPSEVQQEAIPYAILGNDLVCQAKSGIRQGLERLIFKIGETLILKKIIE